MTGKVVWATSVGNVETEDSQGDTAHPDLDVTCLGACGPQQGSQLEVDPRLCREG